MTTNFIPGVKQFKNNNPLLGFLWLIIIIFVFSQNFFIGLILYFVYLKEYCNRELVTLFEGWLDSKYYHRYWQLIIPGITYIKSGKNYLGLFWFLVIFYVFFHISLTTGFILHLIYLDLSKNLSKKRLGNLNIFSSQNQSVTENQNNVIEITTVEKKSSQVAFLQPQPSVEKNRNITSNDETEDNWEMYYAPNSEIKTEKPEKKELELSSSIDSQSQDSSLNDDSMDDILSSDSLEVQVSEFLNEEELEDENILEFNSQLSVSNNDYKIAEQSPDSTEKLGPDNLAQMCEAEQTLLVISGDRNLIINQYSTCEKLIYQSSYKDSFKTKLGKLIVIEATFDTKNKYTSNFASKPLKIIDEQNNVYESLTNIDVEMYAREKGFSGSKEPTLLTGKAEIMFVFDVPKNVEKITLLWEEKSLNLPIKS